MFQSSFQTLSLFVLVASTAASPFKADIDRRADFTFTSTLLTTLVVTESAGPFTSTVNPLDVTSTVIFGTAATWPFTTVTTITTGCVTYSVLYPPEATPIPPLGSIVTSTAIITRTTTVRDTVTVTNTNRPLETEYSAIVVSELQSTGLTQYSTLCTNTMVETFYVPLTVTSTYTRAYTYTRTSRTEVCMLSATRSVAIPGPEFTYYPYKPAIEQFSPGGPTLLTSTRSSTRYVIATVYTDTETLTEVICNNPSTSYTSTYYEVTLTLATTTSYVQQTTGCSSTTPPPAAAPTIAPALADRSGHYLKVVEREPVEEMRAADPIVVVREGPDSQQLEENAANVRRQISPSIVPAGVVTVTYGTTGLVSGTLAPALATAVVDMYTRTFTTVSMVGNTITATSTIRSTVCSIPTAAAKPVAGP